MTSLTTIARRRKLRRLAASAVAVLAAAAVAAAVLGPGSRPQDAEDEPAAAAAPTPREAAVSELPQGAVEAKASYGPAQQEAADLLSSSVWISADGSKSIRFDSDVYEESSAEGTSLRAWALAAAATEEDAGSAVPKRWICAIWTRTGVDVLVMEQRASVDGGAPSWSMTSSLFPGSSWSRGEASRGFEVTPLDERASALAGGAEASVAEALEKYCAQAHPTASKATWTGLAAWDSSAGSAVVTYTLDDRQATTLSAVVAADGSVSVRKGGSSA